MNTIFLASILGMSTNAQDSKTLYRPGLTIANQEISLRSWGSGICSETEEDSFEGTTSIRVTTRNLYQGGILTWMKPVDLAPEFSDKSNLLRITFKSLDGAVTSGGPSGGPSGGGIPSGRGGGGAPTGGAPGGGGLPGGKGGGAPQGGGSLGSLGGPPGGPSGGPQGGATAVYTGLKTMRLIITTTDGKKSEAFVPAATTVGVEKGWKQAGIPLQAIKGFDKTNKIVKEISFSGDVSTAFYVGDLRVISDRTPIRAEPSFRTALLSVNQSLTFSASGYGGSSVLKYSWDFDDADGIQNDAEGANVKYRFRTASNDLRNTAQYRPNGEFTVTLTVSDAYGLKEPYKTTLKVKVNP